MSGPVKLFIAPRFRDDKEDIRLIRTFTADSTNELLFKKLPKDYAFTGFTFVPHVETADFVLIPQSMRKDTPEWRVYFESQKAFAKAHAKEIILFIGTDMSYKLHVDGAIAFKGSAYASGLHANEIVSVPFAEDLSESIAVSRRSKKQKPIVSFCGYAGFPDTATRLKYHVKNIALDLASLVTANPNLRVYKRGIYFRRAAIRALENHPRIEANFIMRDSFAGNKATTRMDPTQSRREYLENMLDSDFVLCPKGDGNYSVRFYEALSLGRIPILIDTDIVLPLEAVVDYSCILRVSHRDIVRLGDIVADFYDSLTDEKFVAMQEVARTLFRKRLRYDTFFNTALPLLKDKGVFAFQKRKAP